MEETALKEIIAQEVGAALAPLAERVLREVAELEALKRRPLLTPPEVQRLYGLKVATLADKRVRGSGPDFIKAADNSGAVFYRPADIERWLDHNRRLGSA